MSEDTHETEWWAEQGRLHELRTRPAVCATCDGYRPDMCADCGGTGYANERVVSARDDYPLLDGPTARSAQRREMCDEIDRLRRSSEMLAAALFTRGVTADQCDALDQWMRA